MERIRRSMARGYSGRTGWRVEGFVEEGLPRRFSNPSRLSQPFLVSRSDRNLKGQ